jgi:hypothetical protein
MRSQRSDDCRQTWRTAAKNERGRLRYHKRPKSREETPKEGIGSNNVAAPQ